MQYWQLAKCDDGILEVKIDVPGKSANAFSQPVIAELGQVLDEIERDTSLRGVLFSSGKKGTFIVGADIDEMKTITGPEQARQFVDRGQKMFERLAQLRVPTVALISGPCLGGGLEFALACKYRIADDSRKTILGLPEVQLGIVPGWGGTVRLPRQIGTRRGVEMISAGKTKNGRQAKSIGLVDDVVPIEAFPAAGRRILERPPARRKPALVERLLETKPGKTFLFNKAIQMAKKQTGGHYPSFVRAIEVIREGSLNGQEAGFRAEQDAIAELSSHPVTIECIRLFFLREETKQWAEAAAPGYSDKKLKSAAVLGAGTMGAGLAYIMADKRIETRLKDVSPELLGKGLKTARDLFHKDAKRKKITPKEAEEGLARISPTTEYVGFKNLDIVIEAVVEDLNVKRRVFQDLERACGPRTILATNTSSLLVSDIAQGVADPARVVGVHFFNPPNKMQLVEVVRAEHTGPEAVKVALALCHQLGKLPIVVKECAGFLVNRLLSPYMNEAGYLLTEVDDPFEIEQAAKEFGFPMGPLKLTDLVGAGVASKVSKVLYEAFGERMKPAPAWEALAELQKNADKNDPQTLLVKGRGGKKKINPKVEEILVRLRSQSPASERLSRTEIAERMVFPIINEAARCLEERIVDHAEQVDLAMVFGTGFAPFRGGPLRYADKVGVDYVVETLDRFAERHPRLAPSEALRSRARSKSGFETALRVGR